MRIAVLAASSYASCQKLLELPSAEVDLDLIGQRLQESDAGFVVHAFRAERRLAEAVEQVLASTPEPVDELLFYFSGYAVASDERGPALLLDGERLSAFSLKRLKRLLAEGSKSSLAILDTVAAFDGQLSPAETLQTLAQSLVEPGSATHVLLASRPEAATSGRSPFTSLFELVLDWQSVKSTALGAGGLYAAMRAEEAMFADLPAVEYFPGTGEFELIAPVGGSAAKFPSLPPPPAVPSEPPPGETFVPAPPSAEERARAVALAHLAEVEGRPDVAIEHLRTAIRAEPRDTDAYRALESAFRKARRPDGCWNAAAALDALGAADVNESLLASAHRPEGLLAAQGVLAEGDWQKKLLCPERDPVLDPFIKALGDAAVAVGEETARRKRRVPALEPGAEQDPEKSTTTLARTLLWSARLLNLPRPKLYVLDGVAGNLVLAPLAQPTMLAAKSLASGLGLPELAFLWARRLLLLRPEHRLLAMFPEPAELELFFRAALTFGPNAPPLGKDPDAKLFVRGLKRHLRGPWLTAVTEGASSVPASRLGARLASFRRSVERAGARAGLLACGNLELALKLTERFPESGNIDAQIADLLAYSVSEEYLALRERLGVAVRAE